MCTVEHRVNLNRGIILDMTANTYLRNRKENSNQKGKYCAKKTSEITVILNKYIFGFAPLSNPIFVSTQYDSS